jgi:hypothetical protein
MGSRKSQNAVREPGSCVEDASPEARFAAADFMVATGGDDGLDFGVSFPFLALAAPDPFPFLNGSDRVVCFWSVFGRDLGC